MQRLVLPVQFHPARDPSHIVRSDSSAATDLPTELPVDWPLARCSRATRSGAIQWHLQRVGRGPTLLLLHGSGAGTFSWAPVVERLSRDFECVLVDLPGHAFSSVDAEATPGCWRLDAMATAIDALVTQEGIALHGIVGHSAGAAIALALSEHGLVPPARVVGVNAALAPPSRFYDGLIGWWMGPLVQSTTVTSLARRIGASAGVLDALLASTGSTVPRAQRACYAACFARPMHMQAVLSMFAQWDLRTLLARAARRRAPAHFLHAADDGWVPLATMRAALPTLPGATLDVVPGGHLVHETHPDLIAARITAHFAHA
jgi:magnesium chelatase accessory protein